MKKYLIGLLAALICILPFNQAEAGVMAQAKKTTQTRKSSTQSRTAAKKTTVRKPVARKHTAKTTQRSNKKTGRKGTKKVDKTQLLYRRNSWTAIQTFCNAEGDKEAGSCIACQPG